MENLGKDLGKLRKFGVALSNLQLGELKVEIDKVYLQVDVVPVHTTYNGVSADELPGIVEIVADYLQEGDFDSEADKHYLPVKEFEELFDDLDVSPAVVRKVLMEKGYIEGSKGRTSTLKKVNGKPVRMIALVSKKFIPSTDGDN